MNALKISAKKSGKSSALDLYRFIAMMFVMLGHFVGTGAQALDIPGVINGTLEHTLLDPNNFFLLKIEGVLYYKLGIQVACVGVVMFFICTGYLVAGMMERYSPVEFLVNRILRVFPTLIFCTLLNGIILSLAQDIHFSLKQYFATMTLTTQYFLVNSLMGVIWTLNVEMYFYLLAALIRKFTYTTISLIYCIIFFIGIINFEFKEIPILQIMYHNTRYIVFAITGALFYITKTENSTYKKWAIIGGSLLISILFFKIEQALFVDTSTYPNLLTHIIPAALFAIFIYSEKKLRFWSSRVISKLSALVYPVYLTHVVVGFNAIFFLSKLKLNRYILIFSAIIVSFLFAWIISKTVEEPSIKLCKKVITNMRKSRIAE